VKASILAEANAFIGVTDPFDLADGDVLSKGNLFTNVTGTTADTGKAFTPPYAYSASGASAVEAAVRSGAGPR
jgi:pectate lyase